MAVAMVEMENEAVNLPLPEEEEEELEEEYDEEAGISSQREDELIDLVMKLKNELVSEKKRNRALEGNIRDEVCEEMAQQLIEIENSYS